MQTVCMTCSDYARKQKKHPALLSAFSMFPFCSAFIPKESIRQPRIAEGDCSPHLRALAVRVDRIADRNELAAGGFAEGRDRGDADHDDEGQHHGVFNSRRTIFLLHERNELLGQLTHGHIP